MNSNPLLLDVYSCPSDPSRWTRVMDRICEETGACSAVLQEFSFSGDGVRIRWQATDQTTAARQRMPMRLVDAENPRLARHRGLRGLNRVVRDEDLFERDDPARDLLHDHLKSMGIGNFMGTMETLGGGVYLGIALHRSATDTRAFDMATERHLTTLAPHLRQACELGTNLQRSQFEIAGLSAHLDSLRCGLILCDRESRVRWMNRSAKTLMAECAGLQVQGGQLRGHNAVSTMLLHEQVLGARRQRCFVSLGQGEKALHLAMRTHGDAQGEEDGLVLLAVTRVGDAAAVTPNAWVRLLGVTLAEASLVATLASGGTIEQHALLRGITTGTVRCQLKQVLAKTGLHRQADLVRLALSSAAAHVLEAEPEPDPVA